MIDNHDDVAEWDGGTWGQEQCLDEADGHRPQGAAPSRFRGRHHRSHAQSVSTYLNILNM